MNRLFRFAIPCLSALSLVSASPALALANRVFVSARSGNDANSCDNILTPCQTFAGAVAQLNPGGDAIVLDSGGYGPVTVTKSLTIEAPPGVLAFIHPPSGDAITVSTGSSDTVTLRGLTLNGGTNNGITVNSVGELNVENCFITGFSNDGIQMAAPGLLNVKATDITTCNAGIELSGSAGARYASIDHCHLDANFSFGFVANMVSPGSSSTVATYTTANFNSQFGWRCNLGGKDVLDLEFCTGSGNGGDGLINNSTNAATTTFLSNCVFSNNMQYGVYNSGSGTVSTRGNNTGVGNGLAATNGVGIGSFSGF